VGETFLAKPLKNRGRQSQIFPNRESRAREPQPLVADPGVYSIVGYDPGGEECIVRIEVTGE
jgi:hypothetical protein